MNPMRSLGFTLALMACARAPNPAQAGGEENPPLPPPPEKPGECTCVGQPGPQGLKGEPGQSIVGPPGPAGKDGKDSTVPGPQGLPGPAGKDGKDGKDSTVPGPPGPAGKDGAPGRDAVIPDDVATLARVAKTEVEICCTNGMDGPHTIKAMMRDAWLFHLFHHRGDKAGKCEGAQ